jgi:hypothetical protein
MVGRAQELLVDVLPGDDSLLAPLGKDDIRRRSAVQKAGRFIHCTCVSFEELPQTPREAPDNVDLIDGVTAVRHPLGDTQS